MDVNLYSATRKARGKRQEAKVDYKRFSAFINVLTLMGSAIFSYLASSINFGGISAREKVFGEI
ncbi:MAG: hypothetical protein F6J90_31490 [Moorea sp. SIOASIH]|uniref:hypothetical protein n=1 Tax=Moorena sp. SIOASIH TaxID=2607817 RepID=UPI0013B9B071|nr:hypothetical protein [Moorena sp. SIOASIH]NEO40613.1 hypothetical protein [Moorena sp. SIOASIH]